MHGKAESAHSREQQTLSSYFQPTSISDVRFCLSLHHSGWLGKNVLSTEPCQLPVNCIVNLATPLWAWVKSGKQTRVIYCRVHAYWIQVVCHSNTTRSTLITFSIVALAVWRVFVRFWGVFTGIDHFCKKIARSVLPSWRVIKLRGLVTALLLLEYQDLNMLCPSHKWYSIVI